jgi:hypothetical protein
MILCINGYELTIFLGFIYLDFSSGSITLILNLAKGPNHR